MLADAQIIQQGQNYYVKHGDDNGLYVEFTMEAIKNEAKSNEAGRPIFEDKEYITIRIVGDTKTVRKRPVQHNQSGNMPPDTVRWPHQYAAFKNQQKQDDHDGTPITEWAMITKSDALEMKAMNIHTVEQLAALGENNIGWRGGRQMRDKAKAWLESAKSGAGVGALQARLDSLEADNIALRAQIAALGAEPKEQKKRGRPPKQDDVEHGENLS